MYTVRVPLTTLKVSTQNSVRQIPPVSSENLLYESVFKHYNVDLFLLSRFSKKCSYINTNRDSLYNFNGFGIYSLFNH